MHVEPVPLTDPRSCFMHASARDQRSRCACGMHTYDDRVARARLGAPLSWTASRLNSPGGPRGDTRVALAPDRLSLEHAWGPIAPHTGSLRRFTHSGHRIMTGDATSRASPAEARAVTLVEHRAIRRPLPRAEWAALARWGAKRREAVSEWSIDWRACRAPLPRRLPRPAGSPALPLSPNERASPAQR